MHKDYVNLVRERLAINFEIEENGFENGVRYDLIARYFDVSGRIFITPQDIIDRMESYERCYVKCFDSIGLGDVEEFFQGLCGMVEKLKPGKDHFQTDITGVMVCAQLPPGIERHVRRLRYDRTFRLYFRGWAEVRLVCVDLSAEKVCANPPGKELKKVYSVKKQRQSGKRTLLGMLSSWRERIPGLSS